MKHWIYKLQTGIHNLIIWFPIIWKHRDYDYIYVSILLKHALKLLSNTTEYHISTAHKLLDKFIKVDTGEIPVPYINKKSLTKEEKSLRFPDVIYEAKSCRVLSNLIKQYYLYWWS
jgi:hypothetical protein